jgi:hypothetical protein
MLILMEWLQSIGALLTMAFGMYGVGIKPRNERGQLTREGKVVLTGIAMCGLVAFSSTAWQIHSSAVSAEHERARFSRLLESVERTTYASEGGLVSFEYVVDLSADGFFGYGQRLAKAYADRKKDCGEPKDYNADVLDCGDYAWVISEIFDQDAVHFDLTSSLAPAEDKEWIANQILRFTGPSLNVYDERHTGVWPETKESIAIVPEDLRDQIELKYGMVTSAYGSTEHHGLHVSVHRASVASLENQDIGITSLADMLGKVVKSSLVWDRRACSPTPDERDIDCMPKVISAPLRLKSFKIDFPHGVAVTLVDQKDQVEQGDELYLVKTIPSEILELERSEQ